MVRALIEDRLYEIAYQAKEPHVTPVILTYISNLYLFNYSDVALRATELHYEKKSNIARAVVESQIVQTRTLETRVST